MSTKPNSLIDRVFRPRNTGNAWDEGWSNGDAQPLDLSTPPQDPSAGIATQIGGQLMSALQPRPISAKRQILSAFLPQSFRGLVTGETQQAKQVGQLGQQFNVAEQIANLNRQQNNDVYSRNRQASQDDLNRRNIESEITTRENPKPVPLSPDVQVFNADIAAGKSVQDAYAHMEQLKKVAAPEHEPNIAEDLKRQIAAADASGNTKQVGILQKRLKALDPMGQQRINISVGNSNERKAEASDKISRADVRQHDKDYVVPAEGVEKSYQMMNHAYDEYKAAKAQGKTLPTGAQSMLALSSHLATTFGNVKGARVTRDMIQHHLGARSISDSALVAVQKLTNGDVLSPAQWDAFHDLIGQSRKLSWDTATKEAKRKNIPIDFLPEDLGGSQGDSGSGATKKTDPLGIF